MKAAIVIPARLGATRLPRKPLRELGGKPLIIRVWERVSRMGVGDMVVVATDRSEVADILHEVGATVVMTSSACASGTERVAEVAFRSEFAEYDTFVNVQGDEPLIGKGCVQGATEMVTSGRFELGTAAVRADDSIFERNAIVKVVIGVDGRALYFSRAPIPYLRDVADAPTRGPWTLQHIGVYAYSRDALERWTQLPPHPLEEIERLEQLRPLAHGMNMGVALINEQPEGGIDTEIDLQRANERWTTFATGY